MTLLQIGGEARCHSYSWTASVADPVFSSATTIDASAGRCVLRLPDIPDRRYRLRSPMVIEVETDEVGFVISQPQTDVFGYADDLSTALNRFFAAFIGQYEFLRDNASRLSPSLKKDFEKFESLLSLR